MSGRDDKEKAPADAGAFDDTNPPEWLRDALNWTPPPATSRRGRKPGSRSQVTNTHRKERQEVGNHIRDDALRRLLVSVECESIVTDPELSSAIVRMADHARVTPRTLKKDIADQMAALHPSFAMHKGRLRVSTLREMLARMKAAREEAEWLEAMSHLSGN